MKSKRIKIALVIIGHLLALGILAWIIYPLTKFYFSGFSAFGDWFAAFTFADYIKNHFSLPPASWVYSLKTGAPLFNFYQWFHFYLMLPFTHLLGTGTGMELYSFITLMLFFLFSYLFYWQLSKNHFFSALLTIVLYFSLGVLDSLLKAGFIAQNATQFMLPLALWLITLFYQQRNRRYLVLAGIVVGLSLMGHGISSFLIAATTVMVFFFWWGDEVKLFSKQKIIDTLNYILIIFFIGFPAIMMTFTFQFGAAGRATCETDTCVASLKEITPYFNNWSLYIMLAMAGIAVLWSLVNLKLKLKRALPFLALLGFIFIYLASTHYKLAITDAISVILWPMRTVWVISLGMGAVAAALFGEIKASGRMKKVSWGLIGLLTFASLGLIIWLGITKPGDSLPLFEENRVGYEAGGPHIVRFTVDKYKTGPYQNYNLSMVLPEWLPPDDIDYRIDQLWHGDFCVWPLLAKVPDIRSCGGTTNVLFDDWRSWITSAETDQLGEKELRDQQRQSNINQSLFMVDWYAIRYLNTSIDVVSVMMQRDFPYADYMKSDQLIDRHEERPIRFEGKERASYLFNFWRIKEEFTSPIIKAVNVPTIFFVGDYEGWGNFVRALGVSNTNSRQLVPVKGPQIIEDINLKELENFDMVVLYAYNYDNFNRAWDKLKNYVEKGGVVLIDTGREVKESENATLLPDTQMAEILTANTLKRESLGTKWNLQVTRSVITQEIKFDQFSPLLFGEDPWKLSYVPDDSHLRSDAQVVLRQSGKPVLVTRKFGQGKVIWSGLNLPYYILNYQAVEESKLLSQIIGWGVNGLGETKPDFEVERISPERVRVVGENFKGVVFKENYDSGWKAKVNGRGVKVYSAGPDVMYIPVTPGTQRPIKVELVYRGNLFNWFVFLVSFISLVICLYYVLFGSLIRFKPRPLRKTGIKIGSWWEDEEG